MFQDAENISVPSFTVNLELGAMADVTVFQVHCSFCLLFALMTTDLPATKANYDIAVLTEFFVILQYLPFFASTCSAMYGIPTSLSFVV